MPKSLIVNGDTTLEGDVTLANGYLRIYSNPRLTEEGKVSKEAGLQVHGESKFGGDVTITQGTLNILENTKYDDSGRPIFISDPGINCAGDIHCDSDLVALGKLDVTGDAQLTNINCDSLHANGDVHIIGGLDIGSAITINGDPLSVYQIGATGTDLTLSGTLNVLQCARIGGDISITGSINLFGDLTIGESSLKEFMDQESQTSKSFENLCLSGALMVCNDAHFYNNINILKDTTISGTATVNGNINVGGILTLNETKFDQNGTSTIGTNLYALKNLTVDGDTILNELLTVASSAQIDGNLNIDGELTVNGEPISSGGKASTEGTSLSLSDDLMVKGCTTLYGETKIYNKTNISGELSASSLETGEAVTSSVNTQTIDINNRHLLQLGINTSSTSGALSNGALIIKLDSMENDLPLYLDFHYEGDHTNWKIGSGISGKNLFVHMTIWVQSADVSTATASILEKQTYVNGTSHNIDIFSPCATVSGWPYEKIIKIKFPLAETASCSSTYGTLYCDIMGTHIESITIGDY
jgi:cytoskeletal protein CcmA (bactofilin family)